MEVKDKIPALDTQLEYISKSKPKLLLTVFKLFFLKKNKYIYTIFFFCYHMLLNTYKLFSNLFKL